MRPEFDSTRARNGLLREAAAYVGHGLLYGFGYLPSRHQPVRSPDLRTIVFVHGLGGNRAGFLPLQGWLSLQGYRRQLAINYRSRGSIEGLAIDLKRRLDAEVKGGAITLVAHSMGGLVSRAYLQMLGGDRRVDTLITIATPHQGSHAAPWVPTKLGAQLHPDGAFLERLAAQPPPRDVRCVSYVAGEDLIVLPPRNAVAPFGEHKVLDGRGHLDIMFSRELFRSVDRVLHGGEV